VGDYNIDVMLLLLCVYRFDGQWEDFIAIDSEAKGKKYPGAIHRGKNIMVRLDAFSQESYFRYSNEMSVSMYTRSLSHRARSRNPLVCKGEYFRHRSVLLSVPWLAMTMILHSGRPRFDGIALGR